MMVMIAMCMRVIVAMRVIMRMIVIMAAFGAMRVVFMPVIMVMPAAGTMDMRRLDARGAARFPPGDRLGHQPIFLGLYDDVRFRVVMPVVMVVMAMMIVVVLPVIVMPMVVMIMPGDTSQTVGAAFRLEGRRHETNFGPEFLDQFDEHIIVADTQRIWQQLRRRMPVAEMPGNARDDVRIRRAELDKPLRLAFDRNDRAGFQFEPVTVHERRRLREVDEKFGSLFARQGAAPAAAIVEIEFDGVGHAGGIIAAGGEGFGRSDHDGAVSKCWSHRITTSGSL
jgi:hypothetical protein